MLLRNAVDAQLDPVARRGLHLAIAGVLEAATPDVEGTAYSSEPTEDVARLAHHYVESQPEGGHATRAAHYAGLAAREATARYAFAEAATWLEHAIRLGTDCDDAGKGRLWLALGRSYERDGQLRAAREAYTTAAAYARDAGDGALLADVAVVAAGPWASTSWNQAVLDLLDEALTVLDEHDLARRAQVLNSLAAALYYVDAEREGHVAREALAVGELLDDDAARAAGRLALHRWLTHRPDARRERLELSEAIVALTSQGNCPELDLRARRLLLGDRLENADVERFDRELDAYERDATERHSHHDVSWAMSLRATQAMLRGDLATAEQYARGAELRGGDLPDAAGACTLQRFIVRYQQGRLPELARPITRRDDGPEAAAYPVGFALTATAAAELGNPGDGARIARRALGDDGRRMPLDAFWLAAVALFAGVAAAACDLDLVDLLTDLLRPCADHVVVFGVGGAVLGTGHHWLGVLAAARDDRAAAVEHLTTAIDMSERIGAPYWGAQARVDLAATTTRHGGDANAARLLLDEATTVAQRGGYGRILARAAAVS
jgi:tetratricopeptide (TPR) repeat protein